MTQLSRSPEMKGASPSSDWREHLGLFDPDGILDTLLEGFGSVIEDRYSEFCESQLRIARFDTKLRAALADGSVKPDAIISVDHFRARFNTPVSDQFAANAVSSGQLIVSIGASPRTGMALLSCAYGEALKLAMERLDRDDRKRAVRGIRMMTSIESDIMVTAMHEALRSHHSEQLRTQAEAFESSILETVKELSDTSKELRVRSTQASTSSQSLQQASSAVAAAADESTVAMEEANRAVQDVNAMIAKVQANVVQTDQATGEASKRAANAAASAKQLSESSTRISEVVKLIRGVADQTQILALNASIEAARADNNAASFSVVANEVKQLAARTRDATGAISDQVKEMIASTQESAEAADEIDKRMAIIGQGTDGIREQVDHQLGMVDTILTSITETLRGAEHVSKNVAAIHANASEVAERFAAVETDCISVDELLDRLTQQVRTYREAFDRLSAKQAENTA